MMPSLPYRFRLPALFLALFLYSETAISQSFVVYDSMPQLEARILQGGESTLVINFWATWCKPCVEELPCFETLHHTYADQNVQVILVSLDFKSQLEKKFVPFLKSQNFDSEVILFADQDVNTWIPRLYEAWDGAIPATFVIRGKQRDFKLGQFSDFSELEKFVLPYVAGSGVEANAARELVNAATTGK